MVGVLVVSVHGSPRQRSREKRKEKRKRGQRSDEEEGALITR